MTKQTLFVLCASLCLSLVQPLVGGEALAQSNPTEVHKAQAAKPSEDKNSSKKSLLADKLEIKKKISNVRRLRDDALREREEREALQSPAEELYGEDSWGEHVNPFAGLKSVDIPESCDISLDGFVMPIERRQVTSHFGYRRRFGRQHYGTDLALSVGDTVRAAFSGKVRVASYDARGYGHYLVIRHPNGLETVYGHLHRRIATEGTIVRAGDPIGLGGNTGRSTGPHLHFEARFMGIPLNPAELFDFELGAPHLDSYAFVKGTRRQYSSSPKVYAKSKRSGDEDKVQVYRVQKGDTLSKIARVHGLKVAQLRKLNALKSDKLQLGQSIRVS